VGVWLRRHRHQRVSRRPSRSHNQFVGPRIPPSSLSQDHELPIHCVNYTHHRRSGEGLRQLKLKELKCGIVELKSRLKESDEELRLNAVRVSATRVLGVKGEGLEKGTWKCDVAPTDGHSTVSCGGCGGATCQCRLTTGALDQCSRLKSSNAIWPFK
jgi:hypothetical protein